jgi:hypothetical protein
MTSEQWKNIARKLLQVLILRKTFVILLNQTLKRWIYGLTFEGGQNNRCLFLISHVRNEIRIFVIIVITVVILFGVRITIFKNLCKGYLIEWINLV